MDIRGEQVQDGGTNRVAISIEGLAAEIRKNRENQPKQLKSTAGGSKCSIFRIPQNLKEINPKAYHPHIVSIGPYHHGKPELSMMEEHKWRFLNSLLARSEKHNGLGLEGHLKAMAKLEDSARACYSEEITTMKSEEITTMNSEEFIRMLLLDGCFLVELFRLYDSDADQMETKEDPIFYIPWLIAYLTRDLLRLENQLPFFVLQHLFDLSYVPNGKPKPSFTLLAINFFRWVIPRPDETIEWSTQEERSHLLDLFRATFIPPNLNNRGKDNEPVRLLHCVTKLLRAGIEFTSMNEANTFLTIEFKKGVLMIPHLKIDDLASTFFQNCIAFEQSHKHCGTYFTAFATFMDCLIDTEKDVALLGDVKVIENYFGTDDEVAKFFNKLGRDVVFDEKNCYLAKEFDEVNRYYRNSMHVRWAEFKSTYFSSPWSFISAMAALILLILTVTQSVYTIYPYYHPNK